MLTLLIYLAEEQEGGATRFPDLGLAIQPRLGRGLLWPNCKEDLRTVEDRTLHAAEPVRSGFKYAMNLWLHYSEWDRAPDDAVRRAL